MVRGRLADDGDARPAVRAAQVPRRVPSGAHLPDPGRPDGRHLPEPLRAAGCCSTSSPAASPTSSGPTATSSTRTAATSGAASSSRSCAGCGRGRRSPSRASTCASTRPASSSCPTRCRRSTSVAPRRRPARSPPEHADVYLTWGEPPAAVAKKIAWIQDLAEQQGRELASASACTPSPRHLRGGVGRGRPAARGDLRRRHPARAGGPQALGVRRAAEHARAQRGQPRLPRDPPQPLGRRRPGPGRRRDGARRQPRGGRRPHRAVRRRRHRRVRPLRLPAPRGRVPLR